MNTDEQLPLGATFIRPVSRELHRTASATSALVSGPAVPSSPLPTTATTALGASQATSFNTSFASSAFGFSTASLEPDADGVAGGHSRPRARTPRQLIASAALMSGGDAVEPWLLADDPPLLRMLEEDGVWVGQQVAIRTIA